MGLNAQDAPHLASRFKAFVSYSHADKAEAQKLHRKLESYRLPKHLRNSTDNIEAADGRIGPIFRDREDLPAAEDLSASVKAALSASEALVVLCSPDAQKSPWVTREIELFRELHPGKPVLAAILRGEPEDAFPEPLKQGREPLAADLRKEGDGPRVGFLKVVAGIAGVPLDTLVNRDAQRNLRRVTTITVASVAAMIVMALMTTFALQARDEAQAQRAEAEGLVEYMLTDLRDGLKGVGRLDLMTDVNERAMDYYEGQAGLSDLPAESLGRRARILHAMGEEDDKRGALDKARAKFAEAHRVTEALLALDSDHSARIAAHAKSKYWVAYAKQQTDPEAALQDYTAALNLLSSLELERSAATDIQRQKGLIHNALGVISYSNLGKVETALSHFVEYNQIFEVITNQPGHLPKDRFRLADSHSWIAEIYQHQGKLDEALAGRDRQVKILDSVLSDDPENDYMVWSRIGAERAKFRLCYRADRLGCARGAIAAAKKILTSRDFDRSNRDWLWQSAYVTLDEGFLHVKLSNQRAARAAFVEGQKYVQQYGAMSPDKGQAVEDLNMTLEALRDLI